MTRFLFLLILSLFAADLALAAGGGGGLPWENPLTVIKESLTGPVAAGIIIIAVFVLGGILVMGGDLMSLAKGLVAIVIAGGLIIGATTFVTKVFGVSGAVVEPIQIKNARQDPLVKKVR